MNDDRWMTGLSASLALHGLWLCLLAFTPAPRGLPPQSFAIDLLIQSPPAMPKRITTNHSPTPPKQAQKPSLGPNRRIEIVQTKKQRLHGQRFAARPGKILKNLQVLKNPSPVYPAIARLLKKEGEVTFSYTVSPQGKVEDVKMVGYSGHASFIEAAEKALRQQKFVPPGQPVKNVRKTFAFRL